MTTGPQTHDSPAGPPTAPDPRATAPGDPLLEVRGLSKSFRGLKALTDYELRLPARTIHGVIGPNGAGKTTLFHILSGFLQPTAGSIWFDGPTSPVRGPTRWLDLASRVRSRTSGSSARCRSSTM